VWTHVLTDRRGNRLGELRLGSERGWKRTLNRGRSSRLVLPAGHPLRESVQQADKVLVKAYDDRAGVKTLRHVGPITSLEKAAGEGGNTLQVGSTGPEWWLLLRLVGKSVGGATFGAVTGLQDRGEGMGQLVDALNAGAGAPWYTSAGDTGIRRGNIAASSASYFGPWRYLEAGKVFTELATGLDAPDWDLRPVEPVADALGVQIAALDVAPAFGTIRGDAVFECGTGRRNVPSFRDVTDPGGLANDVVHLPDGFPDNALQAVKEQTDAASIADRGLLESVVSVPGLTVDDLRDRLLAEHLRIRRQPRRTLIFQPSKDLDPDGAPMAPQPFVDYDVGDVVPFRGVELLDVYDQAGTVTGQREVVTVDAFFRVFSIDVAIDEEGGETVTLTFSEEGGG
jgi:hypothetical protein